MTHEEEKYEEVKKLFNELPVEYQTMFFDEFAGGFEEDEIS